jgi:hypothetical protein
MKLSFDQIRRQSFRALDAAGAAEGIDEDCAYAVAWLESAGLGGLKLLADALDGSTRDDRHAGLAPQDGAVSADGRSCMFLAPLLIDYLIAGSDRASGAQAQLVINDAKHPIVLLAAAARFCPADRQIDVAWSESDGVSVNAGFSPPMAQVLIDGKGAPNWASDATVGMISLTCSPADPSGSAVPTGLTPHLDRTTMSERLAAAYQRGVEVDADAYDRVSAYAVGVLVPETEESRAHGAGAGLTDND